MKVRLKPGELSRLLDEKGLRRPYRDLGKTLGCSASLIVLYLHDRVESPSVEMLVSWAKYLGVGMEDLLIIEEEETDEGDEGNKQRPPAHISEREARLLLLSLP